MHKKKAPASKSGKTAASKPAAKKQTPAKATQVSGELVAFRKKFLAELSASDVAGLQKDQLDAIISRHWNLTKSRRSKLALVEVANPSQSTHGWVGAHTTIDIVCHDMAFIIDSVASLIAEKSYLIEYILHPLMEIEPGKFEAHLFIQLGRRLTDAQISELREELDEIILDVRAGTKDWLDIKATVKASHEMLQNAPRVPEEEMQEYLEFVNYIHDDNFTLLGSRSYKITGTGKAMKSTLVKGSGKGLLSEDRPELFLKDEEKDFVHNYAVKEKMAPVFVTKLSRKSSVHRRVPLDAITVRQYDNKGTLVGEVLIIGLFTSVTYSRSIRGIPFLRWKTRQIIKMSGFADNSHDNRALRHILEKYPRDELFQIPLDDLYEDCMSILRLQERPRIALYTRADPFGRSVSCLVYIPRERFDSRLRAKMRHILEDELQGTCTNIYSTVDDSPLVRAIFVLEWKAKAPTKFDEAAIEVLLQDAGQTWTERLHGVVAQRLGNDDEAAEIAETYGPAFPIAYQENYQPRQTVHDIGKIEAVRHNGMIELDLYKPHNNEGCELSLKLYSPRTPVILSDILPMLENMGLRVIAEYPYEVTPSNASENETVWIQDFLLEAPRPFDKDEIKAIKPEFEACLERIWSGEVENDTLNKLVLLSGMSWREVVILRTYVRYMRQTKIPFSLPYMEQALTDYPVIAKLQAQLFRSHLDPSLGIKGEAVVPATLAAIDTALGEVKSIDQDRVLRNITAMIEATLRTNYYQTNDKGQPKSYLSIKLDSSRVPELPDPRPFREIFVYSTRVEAIHLRADRIARGGIRWSDRNEDFRTEVLGLMKAQQVKNAVIVPMGAKGGFVVKRPPKEGGREAYQKEGIECYKLLIRGMLDITDNQKGSKILPPANTVRRDEGDPYIVAAADKGTATFSDIANGLSLEYGFWLGDAFASGGSAGYDHKKMGITARGAWESVKRHFRELNHDTQTKEFDVVGVGDMAGDVFGNGMLQSDKIQLVGAFNHVHIFCDPNPDAASSFKERERLFKEVKGWDHYDLKKLSKGGRICNRSDKALQLTPEIQKRFDLDKATVTPSELMTALLKARTDLLFFGGIGTYIKSTRESHQDAGDRSNDVIRIDAPQVRAKVLGEGANLGMTQLGRIEYALHGGRLNTDFIDNSAGVDTSDHEVNIKILLSGATLETKERMKLLSGMTEDVGGLVLRDNYQQTQALSLMELQAAETLPDHASFMTSLERDGQLNRKVEFLPDEEEINARLNQGRGLTRPELSLILCYGKIAYTRALLGSTLPDDAAMLDWAVRYFPEDLQKKYLKHIGGHRLKREIVATAISNAIINRMGPTFMRLTMEKTGADAAAATNAFMTVRDAFSLRPLWDAVEAQDNKVPAMVQLQALRKIARMAERETLWFLTRLGRPANRDKDGAMFSKGIETLRKNIKTILPADAAQQLAMREKKWREEKMPATLAEQLALLPVLGMGTDIIAISEMLKTDMLVTAKVYFAVGSFFQLDWLRQQALHLQGDNQWTSEAIEGLMDLLYITQSNLTAAVLKSAGKQKPEAALTSWIEEKCPQATPVQAMILNLQQKGSLDLAMMTVIEQNLRKLV
jgi:glutamate dehydrogenase